MFSVRTFLTTLFRIAMPPNHPDSLSLSETLSLKHLSVMRETEVPSLGGEDLLEKEMSTQSALLARKIPWTEEPGGLQSTGSQRATSLSNFMTEQLHFTSQYTCNIIHLLILPVSPIRI